MNETLCSGIVPEPPIEPQIFNLGKDKLEDVEINNLMQNSYCKWLVYDYHENHYDGSGEAISFDGNKVYVWNLDHCSCYSPSDEYGRQIFDKDFFINSLEYVTGPVRYSNILEKVKELLNVE